METNYIESEAEHLKKINAIKRSNKISGIIYTFLILLCFLFIVFFGNPPIIQIPVGIGVGIILILSIRDDIRGI